MEDKYFLQQDKLSIDNFLLIPKMLYKYPKYKKLNSVSRLIYSLYLSRYTNTKYKDDNGPYIIYGDKELMEHLGISRATCARSKKELSDVGLIILKKTTSYNKIYIMNYRNPDKSEFYTESDLETYSFYRFPSVFFDSIFDELSLNAKILYTYYFDWMCLSQMNYIVDDYQRIFFRENRNDQEANILMNKSVILEAKKQLIAADLLIEYQNFSKAKNYYLLKLANYNPGQLETYNKQTKNDRKIFLQNIAMQNKALITVPAVNIRELRKSASLSVDFVVSYLLSKGFQVSPHTYNRYERGTRKIPKEILEEIIKLLQTNIEETKKDHSCPEMKHEEAIKGPHLSKYETLKSINDTCKQPNMQQGMPNNETISFPEKKHSVVKKRNKQASEKETNISYNKNYTDLNNTDNKYIDSDIHDDLGIFDDLNHQNTQKEQQSMTIHKLITLLDSSQKYSVIVSSLQELQEMNGFTVNKRFIKKEELEEDLSVFDGYTSKQMREYFDKLIQRMKGQGYVFKTRRDVISCCLTFLFNDVLKGKNEIDKYITPEVEDWVNEWLKKDKAHFVSDYQWWDDEE